MESSVGIPLKKLKLATVNPDLCIICQKKRKEKVTSTDNGRKKIIDVANVKKDIVFERLNSISADDKFVYHTNYFCYKRYVHYERSGETTSAEPEEGPSTPPLLSSSRQTRMHSIPRDPCSSISNEYQLHCVICGNVKCKGISQKFRIEQDMRAEKFLKATIHFQDEVYQRTCDLQDVYSIFGADLHCHKNCIKNYLIKYDRAIEKIKEKTNLPSKKEIAFNEIIEKLDLDLKKGIGFPLSYLCDLCNELLLSSTEAYVFTNRELKVLLFNHYGEKISFSKAHVQNQSALVFLNDISKEDIAESIRNHNTMKEAAEGIRSILLNEPDSLEDKFCDAKDLEDSLNNIKIPDRILEFFCTLYNIDKDTFYDQFPNRQKKDKVMFLYQKIYYDINNGKKKTASHVINSEMIYDTCRSRSLITSFNYLGLGISYNELRKIHYDLASYVIKKDSNNVPLPSHFQSDIHTIAAFDNFDHNEHTSTGLNSSHDTVSILVQDKTTTINRKPKISETNVVHGFKSCSGPIPCQILHEFKNHSKKIEIPGNYKTNSELFELSSLELMETVKTDVAWIIGRLNLSNISNDEVMLTSDEQFMPSWHSYNSVISERKLKVQQIGYLPVLPYPVTKYDTVYTSLLNFKNILKQLQQRQLAVFCDEGVYHIAREITLKYPLEFNDIVICMGSFHMIKTFLSCIGKYLSGSGCRTIWIDNKIFGVDVVESVLSGKDYSRSIDGYFLLSEVIDRLQWSEFLNENTSKYKDQLNVLSDLKTAISKKHKTLSQNILREFKSISSSMITEFVSHKTDKCSKSQTYQFWDNFVKMVNLLKNLLRADREGNWFLHLHSVKQVMPLFCALDRTNYIRWCSVYIEDMQNLSTVAPDVYNAFLQGKFVVKETEGEFNSTAADMKLEQTINRSSKGKGGVIGATRKKDFVSIWNLTYHERLAINNLGRKLTLTENDYLENRVHHQFTKTETERQESCVQRMIKFVKSKEDPTCVHESTEKRLHNIANQEILPDDVSKDLLEIFDEGKTLYKDFREERFVNKTSKLSEVIHRRNLKTFETWNSRKMKKQKENGNNLSKKELAHAQRIIDIARVRNYDLKKLFRYNLVSSSYLFQDDGLMKSTQKSLLVKELEKYLTEDDYTYNSVSSLKSAYFVDVMACLRKQVISSSFTFGDICKSFLESIIRLCNDAFEIHFVFDSYITSSIKDSERSKRYEKTPIEISQIATDTPLPLDMSSFWVSNRNKIKLEKLISNYILSNRFLFLCPVVLSAFLDDDELLPCTKLEDKQHREVPELNVGIEEADLRLLPHAKYSIVRDKAKRIVILSNDTDILVGFLFHCEKLKLFGLEELWLRGGVGDTVRYIPVHKIASIMGHSLCRKVPAMHCLTGNDAVSKFGTKLSGLKNLENANLEKFGVDPRLISLNEVLVEAEKFLVNVFKSKSKATSMDELRYELYHHSKKSSFIDLPPTSSETKKHCLRAFFNTYQYLYAMDFKTMPSLDPSDYGYEIKDDLLTPTRCSVLFPEDLVFPCSCKVCGTKRCNCRKNEIPCSDYCNCRTNTECKNDC